MNISINFGIATCFMLTLAIMIAYISHILKFGMEFELLVLTVISILLTNICIFLLMILNKLGETK